MRARHISCLYVCAQNHIIFESRASATHNRAAHIDGRSIASIDQQFRCNVATIRMCKKRRNCNRIHVHANDARARRRQRLRQLRYAVEKCLVTNMIMHGMRFAADTSGASESFACPTACGTPNAPFCAPSTPHTNVHACISSSSSRIIHTA